jgi:hypothetical protein
VDWEGIPVAFMLSSMACFVSYSHLEAGSAPHWGLVWASFITFKASPTSPSAFLNLRAASYERGKWLHVVEFWGVLEGWLLAAECQMEMIVM